MSSHEEVPAVFNLLPKNPRFYLELEMLSDHVVKAAESLRDLAASPNKLDAVRNIAEQEKQADRLARDSLCNLDEAFITPLDREDILSLIDGMYSAVETINDVGQRFELYGVKEADPALAKRTETLSTAAGILNSAIHHLRQKHGIKELKGDIDRLHELECRADGERREFLSSVYADNQDHIVIMKRKDLHGLVEKALGDCENVSRSLQRVLLKNS